MEETKCNLDNEAASTWAHKLTKKDILWMREQKKEGGILRVEFGGKYYQVTIATERQIRLREDKEYTGFRPLPKLDLSEILQRAIVTPPTVT